MPTEEMERQRLRGPRTALEKKKKVRWWRVVIDVVTGLMVVSACLVCANLAYLNWTFNEPFYVNGMSMFPTLNADGKRKTTDGYRPLTWNDTSSIDGDIVDYGYAKVGNKGNWRGSLSRYDIVVAYYSEDYSFDGERHVLKEKTSPKIKRLIGMPGETLTFEVVTRGEDAGGRFEFVGDQPKAYVSTYDENYNTAWGKTTITDKEGNSTVLKPLYDESDFPQVNGHVYPVAQLVGGVRSKTWELKDNEYFLMGDNRGGTGHSMDSREKGPIEDFMVIGKAYVITSQRKLTVQPDATLKANFSLGLSWWPWDYIHLDQH